MLQFYVPNLDFRTYMKYSMVFTPPFIASLLSVLLSEPKGSAVASKAPITLCPRYRGTETLQAGGFELDFWSRSHDARCVVPT